jgi:cytochrome b561
MNLLAPRQIARRAVLAPDAYYRRETGHKPARSHATRLLHVLLLLSVFHQLLSSEFIRRPLPGETPSTPYLLHEYIGIATLSIVLTFWLWTFIRQGETKLAVLFPWASPRRIRAIIDDVRDQLRAFRKLDMPPESNGALASAVHGLGLLTVTAMAVTGTVFFVSHGPLAHNAMTLHKAFANLMWAYLVGHAGIAVGHHLLGSDILRQMFWVRRGIAVYRTTAR